MIYIAGPLFTVAEREFNNTFANEINILFKEEVYLPQKECLNCSNNREIFETCKSGIEKSRLVIAILDGPDSDSGTCFEAGYAHSKGIPVIGVRTDFRKSGDDGGLNLMLSQSCNYICDVSSLDNDNTIKKITAKIKKYDEMLPDK